MATTKSKKEIQWTQIFKKLFDLPKGMQKRKTKGYMTNEKQQIGRPKYNQNKNYIKGK